ncbi:calmodulin-like protein [Striga asiatica]|uniref:Calmodulin-like protein n=1 Tax=Striga asiatica TaxID=4170 RepID=A0A5A7QQ56_STRAF|nr:calmodulin-like protein [Striga asiatica]
MERHEQYERVFTRFDSDGDGRICPAELRRCVGSMGGEMTAEEAEAAVELMDSDGDGLLCLDDFLRIVEGAGDEEKAGDLKAAFQMYVQEGGACITPKSLRKMLSRLGERKSVGECRNMIARFDLNGDGVLSFDEFRLMMSNRGLEPSEPGTRRHLDRIENVGVYCLDATKTTRCPPSHLDARKSHPIPQRCGIFVSRHDSSPATFHWRPIVALSQQTTLHRRPYSYPATFAFGLEELQVHIPNKLHPPVTVTVAQRRTSPVDLEALAVKAMMSVDRRLSSAWCSDENGELVLCLFSTAILSTQAAISTASVATARCLILSEVLKTPPWSASLRRDGGTCHIADGSKKLVSVGGGVADGCRWP